MHFCLLCKIMGYAFSENYHIKFILIICECPLRAFHWAVFFPATSSLVLTLKKLLNSMFYTNILLSYVSIRFEVTSIADLLYWIQLNKQHVIKNM